MGAINVQHNKEEIPEKARGNPVYEQTRQDMPLWCCGPNCGRNSRITVFILGIVGIICSCFVCVSPNYFTFVSLRNDTFYEEEKRQPKPFEYATEANVGLFRYQIMDVFEYPWPPQEQRELFDAMHNRELERLAASDKVLNSNDEEHSSSGHILEDLRFLQYKFPDEFYDDDDDIFFVMDGEIVSQKSNDTEVYFSQESNDTEVYPNDATGIVLTMPPSGTPLGTPGQIPDVLPGSNKVLRIPTTSPTSSPTQGNPNDDVNVTIGAILPYPAGVDFDSLFKNGRKGAMWAPIFATIGLFFATTEFLCCIYKCSWLPAALCLYAAFMLQMMTLFLFMSDDFCNYAQDCSLGGAGFLSVVAVLAYMICQSLICMTPRPPPLWNLCEKRTIRKKKKKKKKNNEWDETQALNEDNEDEFVDEPNKPASFIGAYDANTGDRYDDDYGYPDDYEGGYGDYDDGYKDGYDDEYDDYGKDDQGYYGYEDEAFESSDSDEGDNNQTVPGAGKRRTGNE
mmetsp:Transcript_15521/g.43015  ORF Transcript_15521/g.43015 Transcript_15521/m.43015 type:complete len:509 (-) Transcript_15521:192-1718(-)|eukprot:CAMPEP_0172357782 /NCGR_PEP_ID=MMETSP1060-20121228/2112_1 /TAXON_ID=37318 /ORGANISM="Pseudo-nitzschia pungens, Strain cf. cingulata" /LENGTH=508 /DNA_ID=CAMNT_0013078609 /DNA_START=208 /DNA_END=1734 /DNA_ORIENTATION=+